MLPNLNAPVHYTEVMHTDTSDKPKKGSMEIRFTPETERAAELRRDGGGLQAHRTNRI